MSSRFKLHAKTAESVSDAGVVVGCHKRTQCRFSLPNARMLSPRILRTQPYFFGFVQVFLMVLLGAGCDRMKSNHAEIPEELNGASFAAQVEALVPRLMEEENIPGVAIAVIEGGEIVLAKGFGFADLESGTAMTEDHIFNAASISKAVTAWAVMRLVEEEKINLDAPINQYLKRWQLTDGNWPTKDVTVRRLLSHTGGISMPSIPGFRWPQELPGLIDTLSGNYDHSTYARAGTAAELVYEPGQAFHYSGGGFVILQLLIEDVSGLSFADYMNKEVLKPLGMDDSQYGWDEELSRKMATPYRSNGVKEDIFRFSGLAGSALHTSARDLSQWVLAGLSVNRELRQTVISDKTLALMYTPVAETGFQDQELGEIGFAYFLGRDADDNVHAVSHSGDNAGWAVRVLFAPHLGNGFVALTNSDNGGALIQALSCIWTSRHSNLAGAQGC